MSPEKRLQQARELANTGHALASSDLHGAVKACLAARAHLKCIGFIGVGCRGGYERRFCGEDS